MNAKINAGLKVLAIISIALVTVITFTSCIRITGFTVPGNTASQEREVSGIKSVSVSSGMNLYIEQTGSESLRIEAQDNVIPKVLTEITGGNLVIKYKPWLLGFEGINIKGPVNIYLTVKDLGSINVLSGSTFECGMLKTEDLKISLSSGSSGKIELQVSELNVDLSSGSNLEAEGTVKNQEVDLSSGVSYDAFNLESETAELDVSSGAVADVNVSGSLDVDISSGGTVRYKGTPQIISDISSGGNLENVSSD